MENNFFDDVDKIMNDKWVYIQIIITNEKLQKRQNEKIVITRDTLIPLLYALNARNIIKYFYVNIQWYKNDETSGHINLGLRPTDRKILQEIEEELNKLKEKNIVSSFILKESTEDQWVEEMKSIATHAVFFDKYTIPKIPITAKLGFLNHHIRNISGLCVDSLRVQSESEGLHNLKSNGRKLFDTQFGYIMEQIAYNNEILQTLLDLAGR